MSPSSLLLLAALAAGPDAGLSPGWYVSGAGAAAYQVSIVPHGACGARVARLQHAGGEAKGPVALLQTFRADDYRGARLRFSATLDAREVSGWAGLFFRADAEGGHTLVVDDMSSRPVRGTSGCVRAQVVVDVPRTAQLLTLGVALEGTGSLELGGIALEPVPPAEVPLTGSPAQQVGRVGPVTFDATSVLEDFVGRGAAGYRRFTLHRRSPGRWGDEATEVQATLEDGQVTLRAQLSGSSLPGLLNRGRVQATLVGSFALDRQGAETRVRGTLGTGPDRLPASIVLAPDRLELKWGTLDLRLSPDTQEPAGEGCVRYRGSTQQDFKDRFFAQYASHTVVVCGAVLGSDPPPVQTVVALVLAGLVDLAPR